MRISRRAFMQLSALGAGTALIEALTPRFVFADCPGTAATKNLICVFLDGGLDNLAAMPLMSGALDAALAPRRPGVHVPAATALDLNGVIGLHPSFGDAVRQIHLQDQAMKLISSTGIVNRTGSHEVDSASLVCNCAQDGDRNGFLGRLMSTYNLSTFEMLGLQPGKGAPFYGADRTPLLMESLDAFVLQPRSEGISDAGDRALNRQVAESLLQVPINVGPEEASVRQTLDLMYKSLDRVHQLAGTSVGLYPSTNHGQALRDAARVIRGKQQIGDCSSTIIYTSFGGFDTHGTQVTRLQSLLSDISGALIAFSADMKASNLWHNTAILYITEFGRTLATGGADGTDHGHGSTTMVCGGAVNGGSNLMAGALPTENELKTSFSVPIRVDIRNVYEECIRWLGFDSSRIVSAQYPRVPLGIFRT